MREFPRAARLVAAAFLAVAAFSAHGAAPADRVDDQAALVPNWPAPPFWQPDAGKATLPGGRTKTANDVDPTANATAATPPAPFIALTPCRVLDTRGFNPPTPAYGAPNLSHLVVREFQIAGSCGIPSNALAVSTNATIVAPGGPGYLALWDGGPGSAWPGNSTMNFTAGAVLANAAVVPLSAAGTINARAYVPSGTGAADFLLDVNGYYAHGAIVNSLNALTGDVTLAAGANVTVTQTGNTLTVASGGGSGSLPTGAANQTLRNNGSAWAASGVLTNDGTNVGVSGNLLLSPSSPGAGNITKSGELFLHNFGYRNTFLGIAAGNLSMSGLNNTGIGYLALGPNVAGAWNTAIGSLGLFQNTSGSQNVAVGAAALSSNTDGWQNVAVGNNSMGSNSSGGNNTAVGTASLGGNTWGNDNTAIGYGSLVSNTTGYENVGVGKLSMWSNTTSYKNTAVGTQSLYSNTTGYRNTAIGALALYYNQTGAFNVAIGSGAGISITTGNYNIDIANSGETGDDTTIRIGDWFHTRTFIGGIRGATTFFADAIPVVIDSHGQLGTVSSSLRFKENVRDMADASAGLMALRPVTFRYIGRPDVPEEKHFGLIAEEVNEVLPELVARGTDGQIETVKYHELPAMLLNELQIQRRTIDEQAKSIAAMRAEHAAEIRELRRLVESLAGRAEP